METASLENSDLSNILNSINLDNLSLGTDDEPLWDKLIQQIIDGNVIPVIGADLLTDNPTNLHQLIIDVLVKILKIDGSPKSFSELVYNPEYTKYNKKDSIYYQVNNILAQTQNKIPPSKRLLKLLSIKQFPFVITTSFTAVVEQAMRSVWKDELKVMIFNNNPSENDDIRTDADLRKPTIYYMFGKVCEGVQKYVLTDTDILNFVSSWLSGDNRARPKNLCNELKNKYLLMLGNTYSNWLFRFIWYSVRKSDLGNGMLAYDTMDQALINFLNRTETFTKQDTSMVIDQIITRLKKRMSLEEAKFRKPQENMDVFISYSRSDSDIAEKLYNSLTAEGIRVWYDKKDITTGGKFMDEIRRAIRTAKYFVPILTDNIAKEKDHSHVYRNEWETAVEVAISMGRTYIIPLTENGFDFYRAAIPEKLQQHNAEFFSRDDDMTEVAEKIIHKMNQD